MAEIILIIIIHIYIPTLVIAYILEQLDNYKHLGDQHNIYTNVYKILHPYVRSWTLQIHWGNQLFLVALDKCYSGTGGSVDNCGSSRYIMKNPNYEIAQL